MPLRPRKRCPFCHCLYWPDPRSAWRQRACSKMNCQAQRRRESQRRWRKKNPTDGAARRYRSAVAGAAAGEDVEGVPPGRGPLARFPWDEARDELGPEVLVMLTFFGRSLLWAMKDESRKQGIEITDKIGHLLAGHLKDETDRAGRPP